MLTNKIKINKSSVSNGYVNIPLSSNFSPKTKQYEDVERNFDLSSTDIINPIIDFEKIKLTPMDSTQTNLIDSLTFNLHFTNSSGWDANSTNIQDIGFTEDDVKSRRQRLDKTFIRLSFFDSKDLKTQNLLFFSTIFIDSSDLYSEYIKDNLQMDNLNTTFFVQNPKLSSKIKSFEGFNLYLFNGDLSKTSNKTIYMRVDFNSALNGRSTLFTQGKPNNNSGYTMTELYNNLFFEVNCVFNTSLNRHIYYFTNKNSVVYNNPNDVNIKNTINIDLYQAKVV